MFTCSGLKSQNRESQYCFSETKQNLNKLQHKEAVGTQASV